MLTLKRVIFEVRLLPSRLWRHKTITFIRIAVGAVAFSMIVLTGYYAFQVWRHQQNVLKVANITRVEAQTINLDDRRNLLNNERIAELKQSTGAAIAYPKISLSIHLSLKSAEPHQVGSHNKSEYVNLQGIRGDEPEFQSLNPDSHNLFQNECRTLILSADLYDRLGGMLTKRGEGSHSHAVVSISRIHLDQVQHQKFEMRIVAIAGKNGSLVYAPLQLADALDQWQTHKISGMQFFQEVSSGLEDAGSHSRNSSTYASAIFYGHSLSETRRIVDGLEAEGFKVSHQLDSQERLNDLAKSLTLLVALLVSGAVANGVFNSGAVSWLDLQTRIREVGIKLSWGLRTRDLVARTAAESTMVSILAVILGLLAVITMEPFISHQLTRTTNMNSEFFVCPITSPDLLWLYILSAFIIGCLTVTGAVLPILVLVRKMPVNLLGE